MSGPVHVSVLLGRYLDRVAEHVPAQPTEGERAMSNDIDLSKAPETITINTAELVEVLE